MQMFSGLLVDEWSSSRALWDVNNALWSLSYGLNVFCWVCWGLMYMQRYLEVDLVFYCVVMLSHCIQHSNTLQYLKNSMPVHIVYRFSSTFQITVSLCSLLQGDYERPLRDGSPQVTGGDTYPRAPLKQPQSHTKPPGYPPAHLPYPPVFHHYKPSPYHHPPSQPSPPYTPQVQYVHCVHSWETVKRCSCQAF